MSCTALHQLAALLQAHAETAKVRDDQGGHELLVMELRQATAAAAANAERLPELEAQLAAQHEQSDRISQLEAELKAQEQQVSELRNSAASAHAAVERVVELEAQLEAQQRHSEKVADLERQLAAQDRNRESIVDLKAQLASQQRAEVVSDMRRRLSRMVQLLRELPGVSDIPCAVRCDGRGIQQCRAAQLNSNELYVLIVLVYGWHEHMVRVMLNSCACLQLRMPGRGLLQRKMRWKQPCRTYGQRR